MTVESAANPEQPDRKTPGIWIVIALAITLLLSACAPSLAPLGPGAPDGPVLAEDHFTTSDGLALPLRRWLPPSAAETSPPESGAAKSGDEPEIKGVILALHGFNDYSRSFENPGKVLAALGLAVYAYDQRGFGEAPHRGLWAGSDVLTSDLTDASRALRQRHPGKPLYLLGESMGGAVVLAAFNTANPPDADGVILSAPAVWARSTMPWYQRTALWLSAHTIPWAKFTGSGLKIQASDNIEMLRGLGRDPLIIKGTRVAAIHGLVNLMDQALSAAPALNRPALLLYGEKDEIVPREPTLQLWARLPKERRNAQSLALYSNGWHMLLRDLDAGIVLADILQWTEDQAQARKTGAGPTPLPSGAGKRAREALEAFERAPEEEFSNAKAGTASDS